MLTVGKRALTTTRTNLANRVLWPNQHLLLAYEAVCSAEVNSTHRSRAATLYNEEHKECVTDHEIALAASLLKDMLRDELVARGLLEVPATKPN